MRAVGIDTGGTHTRIFADDMDEPLKLMTPATKAGYLSLLREQRRILEGCYLVDAVAGPPSPDRRSVAITNQGWGELTASEIEESSGAKEASIYNDIEGAGTGVVDVERNEPGRIVYIAGDRIPEAYGFLMIPGTGIGVAKITPEGEVLGGEGGWVLAQPTNPNEEDVFGKLQAQNKRLVACEDVAANPAIYGVWFMERELVFDYNPSATCNVKGEEFQAVEGSADKPAEIARLAKGGSKFCGLVMKKAARFLGQCAQANMLSPPLARALCITGSFEHDMEVPGYVDELLRSLYASRHGDMLKGFPVYTIRDPGMLGVKGSLIIARKYAGK